MFQVQEKRRTAGTWTCTARPGTRGHFRSGQSSGTYWGYSGHLGYSGYSLLSCYHYIKTSEFHLWLDSLLFYSSMIMLPLLVPWIMTGFIVLFWLMTDQNFPMFTLFGRSKLLKSITVRIQNLDPLETVNWTKDPKLCWSGTWISHVIEWNFSHDLNLCWSATFSVWNLLVRDWVFHWNSWIIIRPE